AQVVERPQPCDATTDNGYVDRVGDGWHGVIRKVGEKQSTIIAIRPGLRGGQLLVVSRCCANEKVFAVASPGGYPLAGGPLWTRGLFWRDFSTQSFSI